MDFSSANPNLLAVSHSYYSARVGPELALSFRHQQFKKLTHMSSFKQLFSCFCCLIESWKKQRTTFISLRGFLMSCILTLRKFQVSEGVDRRKQKHLLISLLPFNSSTYCCRIYSMFVLFLGWYVQWYGSHLQCQK